MNATYDTIRDALRYLPADCDREPWVRMGMAIKSELGDAGFDIWNEWSQGGESYDPRDAKDVWRSIKAGGKVTIGTLFHEAKAHGWPGLNGSHAAPDPEEVARRKREAEERASKEAADLDARHAKAAELAGRVWMHLPEKLPADNPYLTRKRVATPCAMLRGSTADELTELLGYAPKAGDLPLRGRVLVAPVVRPDGTLSTLELIDGDGKKTALARGRKAGCYWPAQKLPEDDGAELLVIGEGVATVLSAVQACGCLGVATLMSGNLLAVAKAMRERYPTRPMVVLADLVKATGLLDSHAVEAARAVGARLAVPDFGSDREEGQTDFNDLMPARGLEAVRAAIANAEAPAEMEFQPAEESAPAGHAAGGHSESSDGEEIQRLAALPVLEYDRVRKEKAAAMRVRPGTLDKLVASARRTDENDGGIEDVDPWPDPVEPSELLSQIAATVRRFIVCLHETADAVALWVAMTWFMDVVQIAPLAVITAPEKRCGKSLLLFVLGRLSCRPLTASNISPAALFRCIDAWSPTLLVDEADAFARENEELRGLLNCGHTRDGAYVVRTVGDDHTPRKFNTWGAKALAGIGKLADTIMDRAIVLELRRKLPHEQIERLRYAEPDLFKTLARKLARFAEDYRDAVREARPELPAKLNDRAQDNWEPLLAIADVAGGEWRARSRRAALKLSGAESPTMSMGAELLADIQGIFETERVDRISSADLINFLCADEEAPWATHNRGKPIFPRQVSKLLAEYGIRSTSVRIGHGTPKGYLREWFDEAFSRYLSTPRAESATAQQVSNDAGFSVAADPPRCGNKSVSATLEAPSRLGCCGVADRKGESEEIAEDAEYF